ncbi:hypothetical protein [Aquibium pacificus]
MIKAHLLHIRKTGGTAVKHALRNCPAPTYIALWPHNKRLSDISLGEKVVFGVRDPVPRFVSGFNSRLRMGRPRNNRPWTPEEVRAFARFKTPNELAEALSSADPERLEEARRAMLGIRHVSHPLSQTLGSPEYLRERSDDILMILHQSDLASDFDALKRKLCLPPELRLPDDETAMHRTPVGFETRLSAIGRRNIETWYEADYAIYRESLALRDRLL